MTLLGLLKWGLRGVWGKSRFLETSCYLARGIVTSSRRRREYFTVLLVAMGYWLGRRGAIKLLFHKSFGIRAIGCQAMDYGCRC